jgi:hypothetical protein
MTNPMANATATRAPMTMPAIAPPDSPFFDPLPTVVDEADGDDVADTVGAVVEKVMKPVIVGSFTPAHLLSAPEL